ncbi:9354645e-cbb1-45b5-9613-531a34494b22 [Thermothielavioides terrestris]|uniref:9354645e-cbb1-45b5-9613-531a34494b22 n=1 Tax=Thermothielavioides terrestris TaxID=2587410 RepID=A0A446BNJ0_9PEZI|nr:9354645e-cbb1-45b5-9613-531a34494b22 [Thermothielavioides terrestris]
MVVPRGPRILVAVALICFVALVVTFLHRDAFANLRLRPGSLWPSTHTAAVDDDDAHNTTALDPNAHRLPSADSFRAHFAAVTRLKGITMAEAKAGCHWPDGQFVNFQFVPDVEWVVKDRSDDEIAARRRAWQEYVDGRSRDQSMIPWEEVKDKFSGRGVVVLAGNDQTVMQLKVILRRLANLRSTIPVEVHYWDDEMDEATRADLAGLYQPLSFNDLSQPRNIVRVKKDGKFINYQLKNAAVVNSRFAELLLLDSDNVPVLDPAVLFDSRVYQEYRTVFWPDMARTRPQNPAWALTNTPCRMDEYEQESGQMLVDKRRFWYHVQLAAWMNRGEQAAYYNAFLLGDKDMFRFAWHALKTAYGRPRKWLASVGTLNAGFFCGHSFGQHHPDDGRLAFLHGGAAKFVAPELLRWNKEHGGYFRHYKRSPTDEDPSVSVRAGIVWDEAAYMPNRSAQFKGMVCNDITDAEPRSLDDLLPGFDREFEAAGGYWKLEQEEGEAETQAAGG